MIENHKRYIDVVVCMHRRRADFMFQCQCGKTFAKEKDATMHICRMATHSLRFTSELPQWSLTQAWMDERDAAVSPFGVV